MHSSVSTPFEDVDKIYSRHRLFLKKHAWLYSGDTIGDLAYSCFNFANEIVLAESPISHLTSTFSSASNKENRGLISSLRINNYYLMNEWMN